MQNFSFRLSLVTLVFAAAAAPALAGNYAEGDPRPAALTSQRSSAAVADEAKAFTKTAPAGYPEGDPRQVAQVSQKSRAEVRADTLNWMRSGLAGMQDGEVGLDTSHPAYRQAAQAYASVLNKSGTAAAQGTNGVNPIAR